MANREILPSNQFIFFFFFGECDQAYKNVFVREIAAHKALL